MLEPYADGGEATYVASFRFSIEVRPRYFECDGQGHVSNVVYPGYLEASRLQYFETVGDPEPRGSFAYQHVTAELTLRYVGPCFYDERIRVASKVVRLGAKSAELEQAVTGADGGVRALARMTIVRSDGERSHSWTAAQRAALGAYEPALAAVEATSR